MILHIINYGFNLIYLIFLFLFLIFMIISIIMIFFSNYWIEYFNLNEQNKLDFIKLDNMISFITTTAFMIYIIDNNVIDNISDII